MRWIECTHGLINLAYIERVFQAGCGEILLIDSPSYNEELILMYSSIDEAIEDYEAFRRWLNSDCASPLFKFDDLD